MRNPQATALITFIKRYLVFFKGAATKFLTLGAIGAINFEHLSGGQLRCNSNAAVSTKLRVFAGAMEAMRTNALQIFFQQCEGRMAIATRRVAILAGSSASRATHYSGVVRHAAKT